MNQSAQQTDLDLIDRYVAVCNEALRLNRDRFPFRQIWNALNANQQDYKSYIYITDGDYIDKRCYIFQSNDQGITSHLVQAPENNKAKRCWYLPLAYLTTVTNDPQTYINNPALLDWGWLHSDF